MLLRTVLACVACVYCVLAGAQADEETLPRRAEQLAPPVLHSHLAPDRIDVLVGRWFSQIDPADVDGSLAAIRLLDGAPKVFVAAAASRLRESGVLEKIFTAGTTAQKDELRNSTAINVSGLRDLLWTDLLQELQSALADKAEMVVVALMPSAELMSSLPPPLAKALLDALEDEQLGDQVRHEISKILTEKWVFLKDETPRLRSWLSAQSVGGDGSAIRKQVARSVLVRLGEPVSGSDLETILDEGDPGARMAALDWLKLNEPDRWTRLYEDVAQARAVEMWDLASLDHLIVTAGPSQITALNGWSATIKRAPSMGNALDCSDLSWRLSLLSRQTTPRKSRFQTLWDLLSKEFSCADDVSAEIDKALVAVGGNDLRKLVVAAVDKDGAGQLANVPLQLPLLSQSVSGLLEARLAAGDGPGAERFLDLGVIPSAEELEKHGYWDKVFGPGSSRPVTIIDLRALQNTKGAPSAAYGAAARIAKNSAATVPLRSAALLALASGPASDLNAFVTALVDSNGAVSRTSLILLSRAYDAASELKGLPVPAADVVDHVRTSPDLSAIAPILLRSLVRYGSPYDEAYVDAVGEDRWRAWPGETCLALAEAPSIDPATLGSVFAALPTSETGAQNAMLSCFVVLSEPASPLSQLAKAWRRGEPADAPALLEGIKALWEDESFRSVAVKDVIAKIGQIVASAAHDLPYEPSSMRTLAYWRDQLAVIAPNDSQSIAAEFRKRWIFAGIAAVPAGLLLHLALWTILLTAYPRSPWIQAVVFWNPFVRKLLGLGYFDLVLLHVGVARRRLFAPFKAPLLGDVVAENATQLDRLSYFRDSQVLHRPTATSRHGSGTDRAMPLLDALSRHRGRVLLLGRSGLGKSSFLRFSLAQRAREDRDTIVYLRADQCRQGVEAEIEQRMNGLGREQDLLKSMIYSGRLFIYIDGYNEVDLTTQDLITGFLSRYPYANILVASQIPLRGFGTIESFTIVALAGDAIRDFLLSRETVLSDRAPVRGALFEKIAISFLQQINSASQSDVERRAFDEILSNPMDLTSIAILLGDGRTPDLFALEAQQFEGIAARLAETGTIFRTSAFSSALLNQRLRDQENLRELPFQPEVVALVGGKLALVRTDADQAGAIASQEVRFRHDRIRDFFTHFAFLTIGQETRTKYAEDARFAGVFPYLARALPHAEAEELRELLITRAADIEDHRVSDSFVREYSWRQRISTSDPEWILSYDLPEARNADRKLFELAAHRKNLDRDLNANRDIVSKARRMTRILATSDPRTLRDVSVEILCAMGATAESGADGVATGVLSTPLGYSLCVVGLCQVRAIKSFHIEVVAARATAADIGLLVVTNAWVEQDPGDRPSDLDPAEIQALVTSGTRVIAARDLYAAFLKAHTAASNAIFWRLPVFSQEVRVATQLIR